jgi:LysR family transcriptional activator of glutamate synthase operon
VYDIVELRQLQYFVKVAKMQHVTQAAEELRIAQSAVSRQIHQLEEELGISLFVQHGRNLQLTPVGQLFLKRIEAILADIDKAIQEVREYQDPEYGEVRIGFPNTLGVILVPDIVSQFRKEHPNVRFKFRQGVYQSLLRDVLRGELDLAFIAPYPVNHDQVTGESLMTEELFAILPQNHPLADQSSIHLHQLKDDPFILFYEGYSLRKLVWEACLEAGFTPRIAFEGEETDTIRGLVAAGMGVSLLPHLALQEETPLQPVKVKLKDPKVTRTIGLIRRVDEKLPLVAEVFRNFVLKYFKEGRQQI